MKKILGGAFAVLFAGYMLYEGRGLILPPPLAVWSPSENLVTEDRYIVLEGKTAPGAQVQVNGGQILPIAEGYFEERVALQDGLNTLQVKAIRRYSRPRIVERTILVSRSGAAFSKKNIKTGGLGI